MKSRLIIISDLHGFKAEKDSVPYSVSVSSLIIKFEVHYFD